ncbi:MAG TPA: alpha-glucuronidase family glycosyl hydrolase, partial [Blastocatellia bacterium]|nr:alpha-glucuronidase family glycosyl hydrolase [Blastocatellia bacterium]
MNSKPSRKGVIASLAAAIILLFGTIARAEDGYRLWLRYDPLPKEAVDAYRPHVTALIVPGKSATLDAIRAELARGCEGLLGKAPTIADKLSRDGTLIVGTPKSSPLIAGLRWERQLEQLGPEGFRIRSIRIGPSSVIVIASGGEVGVLYATYHFLRLIQTLQSIDGLDVSEKPRLALRIMDHWDNLDGTIERGYAGRSLWNWSALPNLPDPRLRDYARAEASIGINGCVLNNVNANSRFLTAEYLRKVAAIADIFRDYGVRVYLSPRFSAPIDLDGLKTADPLDP